MGGDYVTKTNIFKILFWFYFLLQFKIHPIRKLTCLTIHMVSLENERKKLQKFKFSVKNHFKNLAIINKNC